jgi:divalent metal cation (Fe/Co/Zn/Cd) transporter
VIHMRTSHVSPESLLVTAKIAVPPTMPAADLAAGIDAAEARIRSAVPIAETIYLEPDVYRPDQENGADPSVEVVRRSRTLRPRMPRRTAAAPDAAKPAD